MRTIRWRILVTAAACIGLISGFGAGVAQAVDGEPVVVGSTNFPEQLILANIYADVLKANDIAVNTRLNLGSREIVFPALTSGEIDVLPEYTGALLAYVAGGEVKAHTSKEVIAALEDALPEGITMLKPASAQDKDALVVTEKTARKYDLQTVSDLKPVASKLVLGGPPEVKTRYIGLPGLKEVYGLVFKSFRALDAGGPLTVGALSSGDIDVARMFTTQGIIDAKGWVVLEDDKALVPTQNLVPVVREAVINAQIRSALNAVSAKLKTDELQKLNRQVSVEKHSPKAVAKQWVKEHGLDQPAR